MDHPYKVVRGPRQHTRASCEVLDQTPNLSPDFSFHPFVLPPIRVRVDFFCFKRSCLLSHCLIYMWLLRPFAAHSTTYYYYYFYTLNHALPVNGEFKQVDTNHKYKPNTYFWKKSHSIVGDFIRKKGIRFLSSFQRVIRKKSWFQLSWLSVDLYAALLPFCPICSLQLVSVVSSSKLVNRKAFVRQECLCPGGLSLWGSTFAISYARCKRFYFTSKEQRWTKPWTKTNTLYPYQWLICNQLHLYS